jgi:hypothetical protein
MAPGGFAVLLLARLALMSAIGWVLGLGASDPTLLSHYNSVCIYVRESRH